LIETAEQALTTSLALLEPQVLVKEFTVKSIKHDQIILEEDKRISGSLVTGHLVGTQSIKTVVCTVGSKIDKYASEVMDEDIVLGLAVDGVGSAAVEALANALCKEVELEAESRDFQSTIPLSPGMIGWSVEEGQPIIFDLMDPSQIGIELTVGLN
jgi:hypothetical protein